MNGVKFWKKLKKPVHYKTKEFLQNREEYCVSAISRFNSGTIDNAWAAFSEGALFCKKRISGLLFYGKGLLFPVFHFSPGQTKKIFAEGLPLPFLFSLILKNDPLHAAQGLADDMEMLETVLQKEKGFYPASTYDYELRSLSYSASSPAKDFSSSAAELVIRKAEASDTGALFPLQAGYEKEEVLPEGAEFNPVSCLKILQSLIAEKTILAAELKDKLVGKININAQSYNRFQIGGVYVLPEYRSLGIARAMTAALIREFAPQKDRFTLFVKKNNIPARRVYDSLGFKKIADYRISYFS
ncbi:MAG: GNAT family N-acetyltransferase [Treponema sp.]|nr:GNAT family N-acetyltransferase [Treponema sp.]